MSSSILDVLLLRCMVLRADVVAITPDLGFINSSWKQRSSSCSDHSDARMDFPLDLLSSIGDFMTVSSCFTLTVSLVIFPKDVTLFSFQ